MDHPAQALEDARRAGIDLSLIDVNLGLSYEERALQQASALELAQALREAGAAHYANQAQPARSATEVR